MQAKRQRFSKEQQIALLQEFMASGLSGREYAALKKVGYSTLTKWASQHGISMKKPSLLTEMTIAVSIRDAQFANYFPKQSPGRLFLC